MQHSVEYQFGQYRLTINFWFLMIFLLLQTGLNELGFWQLSRAKEKQARLDILANHTSPSINDLNRVDQPFVERFGQANLSVKLAAEINLLVENKIQNGKLGYHGLNLVEDLNSGRFVLVNRGWIEGKANRQDLPSVSLPPAFWQIEARVYPINQALLSADAQLENYDKIIRLPTLDRHMLLLLEERLKIKIEPYLLRLNKNNREAFIVDWNWVSMSPSKHLGYAFQWFGLSLAFLVISLFALIEKKEDHNEDHNNDKPK